MNTITLKEHRNDVTTFVVGKRQYSENYYLDMVTAHVTDKTWIDLTHVLGGTIGGYYVDQIRENVVHILENDDKSWVIEQANQLAKGRQVFLAWQKDYDEF